MAKELSRVKAICNVLAERVCVSTFPTATITALFSIFNQSHKEKMVSQCIHSNFRQVSQVFGYLLAKAMREEGRKIGGRRCVTAGRSVGSSVELQQARDGEAPPCAAC